MTEFSDLLGKILREIKTYPKGESKPTSVIFMTNDGRVYEQRHYQDCCEQVWLEDVAGDWADLIGSPILKAEVAQSSTDAPPISGDYDSTHTWTYYKLATIKGSVDIRWFGTSNGYYSEEVDFVDVTPQEAADVPDDMFEIPGIEQTVAEAASELLRSERKA